MPFCPFAPCGPVGPVGPVAPVGPVGPGAPAGTPPSTTVKLPVALEGTVTVTTYTPRPTSVDESGAAAAPLMVTLGAATVLKIAPAAGTVPLGMAGATEPKP